MSCLRLYLSGLALLLTVLAGGQNTSSQESRKAKLEKEIAQIDAQLKTNASKTSNAQSNLVLIRKKISNRNELIAESDREIQEINRQIGGKQREITIIQGRLDTLSLYYGNLVRNAYKNRDAKVWYMYLLSSENLGQAYRRMGYLRNLSGQMNVQAKKIEATREELKAETEKLENMRAEAQKLRESRQQEVRSLQSEEKDSQQLITQLTKDRRKYEQELNTKRKQVEALNKEIERIIREATKPAASSSKSSSSSKNAASTPAKTEIDTRLDTEFSRNKGKLPWPVDGPVVDKFGQHNHPVYKNVKLPYNNGVGIAVADGTRVQAVFDGVVKQIVVMPGYNNCVLVQHGSYFSFYCKLKTVNVKAGDSVKTGQTIGTVDTIAGESQLHFQIWKGTTPQNPELWLK
ncbi:MAG: peptidoglycan DD-metalloendopeptidase family protein [Bacteroidales bacterium]|nr:peptidoglycan DD-metalloendopeptidase family protein [Bacteroidales bacterium]